MSLPTRSRPSPGPALLGATLRRPATTAALWIAATAALGGASAVGAQSSERVASAATGPAPTVAAGGTGAARRRLPFAPGEEMRYDAHYGPLKVGRGSIRLAGVDTVRGVPAWHLVFSIRGGTPFFRVDDVFQSWIDTTSLNSLRFEKRQKEGRRTRHARFEIFPERSLYVEQGREPAPTVAAPLDDASFLYFVRTVPLEVGEGYSFDRYFKPDRNPVALRVLRRERVRVPAGTFDAIVVQPQINTSGILGKSRRTELWLSDDSRRLVLRVQSHLPFGTLTMALTSYRPGAAGDDEAPRHPVVARREP